MTLKIMDAEFDFTLKSHSGNLKNYKQQPFGKNINN